MIFAAGLGSRLRPLTNDIPKALVEVGGVPMLERVIIRLISFGITEIIVNVHHFSSKIIEFLKAKNNFGVNIIISDESDKLLDTGGGVLKASKWLKGNEPILLYNTDILSDFDIYRMEQEHIDKTALATLLVKKRQTSRYLLIDEKDNMRMHGWTNIKTGDIKPTSLLESINLNRKNLQELSYFAFGGVHIVSSEIFPLLEEYSHNNKVFSIMSFYIDLCNSHKICGFVPLGDYLWFDIGKMDTLGAAEETIRKKINL